MLSKKTWSIILVLAFVVISPFFFLVCRDIYNSFTEKPKNEKRVISTNLIANGVVCVTYFDAAKEKPVTMDCVEPVIRGHKEAIDAN